jgi:hypothetical protein
MPDERWNPTPPGWKPMPMPRVRGEELWRLTHGDRVVSCELRDDYKRRPGFEVIIRHDDGSIIGQRCLNEAEARYYAETFRQEYVRSGWTDSSC